MSKKTRVRQPDGQRVVVYDVVDDYGTRRSLRKAADCDCLEGVLETPDGPMPYTFPRAVVEAWMRARP